MCRRSAGADIVRAPWRIARGLSELQAHCHKASRAANSTIKRFVNFDAGIRICSVRKQFRTQLSNHIVHSGSIFPETGRITPNFCNLHTVICLSSALDTVTCGGSCRFGAPQLGQRLPTCQKCSDSAHGFPHQREGAPPTAYAHS